MSAARFKVSPPLPARREGTGRRLVSDPGQPAAAYLFSRRVDRLLLSAVVLVVGLALSWFLLATVVAFVRLAVIA